MLLVRLNRLNNQVNNFIIIQIRIRQPELLDISTLLVDVVSELLVNSLTHSSMNIADL